MKIWIDKNKPAPNETYTHCVKTNDEAKQLIISCESNNERIYAINVDDTGLELMLWLIHRQKKYPIIYHCEDENKRLEIQELFETHWLLY